MTYFHKYFILLITSLLSSHALANTTNKIAGGCGNAIYNNEDTNITIVCNDPVAASALNEISNSLSKLALSDDDKFTLLSKKIEDLKKAVLGKSSTNNSMQKEQFNHAIELYLKGKSNEFNKIVKSLTNSINQKVWLSPIFTPLGMGDTYQVTVKTTPKSLLNELKCKWALDSGSMVKMTHSEKPCSTNIVVSGVPLPKSNVFKAPKSNLLSVTTETPSGKIETLEMPIAITNYLLRLRQVSGQYQKVTLLMCLWLIKNHKKKFHKCMNVNGEQLHSRLYSQAHLITIVKGLFKLSLKYLSLKKWLLI